MLTNKLCKACGNGDIALVEQLLESGATPNFASSGNGYRYPLHYAADIGHVEIVKVLLQNEAAVDPQESSNAWTPLMVAALKSANSPSHAIVILTLIQAGADVEMTDAKGNTVVHILASLGQTQLIKQLLEKVPSLDIMGPGFGYLTPLHYATEAGHADTIEFLLQQGADPRGIDATGWTPLHWACRRGNKQVIDHILLRGAQELVYSVHCTFTTTDPITKSADGRSSMLVPSIPDVHSSTHSQGDGYSVSARQDTEPRSRRPDRSCRILYRSALASLIVFFSVYDYASRVSWAALIAAVAQKAQGAGPVLFAALALASGAVALPSVALWICCYSHLKRTWAWAGWKAVGAVRLFANPAESDGEEAASHGVLAVSELRAVRKLRGLRRCVCSSKSSLLARLTIGGFVLPLAAFVGSLVVCIQVTAVLLAASLAVVAMCAYISFGLLATKSLLGFQGGLLHFLDTLTHGSAVKLVAAGRCEQTTELDSKAASSSSRPTSEERRRQDFGRQPDGSHDTPRSPPHPECRQALQIISEDASGCDSVGPSCHRGSDGRGCHVSGDDKPAPPPSEGHSKLKANAHIKSYCLPRIALSYRIATLSGSVPRELHPCVCLSGAIRLHHQHWRSSRGRNCASTDWHCRHAVHGKDDDVPSSSHSSDKGNGSTAGRTMELAGLSRAGSGWRFHRSSAGLFADSVGPTIARYTEPADICEAAKKRYWSSGLEAGSIVNVGATADSRKECLPSDGGPASSDEHNLLSFAYRGWPREARQVACGSNGSSDRRNQTQQITTASPRAESFASLLDGASPFEWLRGHTTQQCGTTVHPQLRPSFRSQETRTSRPGIPAVSGRNGEGASFRFNEDCRTPNSSPGCPGAQHSWFGVKLLFTAHGTKAAALTPADVTQKRYGESALLPQPKICILKGRKQKPAAVELDSAEYRDLVLRREQRIFDWFEQVVAVRYLEVKRLTQATATLPNDSDFEDGSYRFEEVPLEPAAPCASRSTSMAHEKESIRWSSFQTLFPAGPSARRPEESSSIAAAVNLHEPQVLSCVQTEDLFDMSLGDPTPRSWLLQSGKRCQKRQRVPPLCGGVVDKPSADTLEMTGSHKVAVQRSISDRSSSYGINSSEGLALPIIHYRFSDMVQMPHLREAFFTFWSREFEKLLVYQDQYFGDNPLWIGNVLEEDSVSAFSQEPLFSSALTAKCTSSSGLHLPSMEQLPSDCHLPKGVHWFVPQRTRDFKGDCREQSAADARLGCEACMQRFGGPTGICICQGIPEPPMTYAIGMDLAKLENNRGLTYLRDKFCLLDKQLAPEPSDAEAALSKPCWQPSHVTSTFSEVIEAAEAMRDSEGGSGKITQDGLPAIEACRFMFALVLTTDLLLGLFPLLASLLLMYFLPQGDIDLSAAFPGHGKSGLAGDCANVVPAPVSIPGGYLVSSQSITSTSALCALHLTSFWNIFLALVASFTHAALLSSQATDFFCPMSIPCVPVAAL